MLGLGEEREGEELGFGHFSARELLSENMSNCRWGQCGNPPDIADHLKC